MLSAILLLASLAPTDKLDDPTPPPTPPAVEAPAPPDRGPLLAPSCPCNQAATEGAIRDLRADLGRLRAELAVARANPPAQRQAQAPAAPPRVQLWELYDTTGVRCTGRDPDELSARVAARDAYFARQAAARTVVVAAPAYATYAAPMVAPAFSAPMSFGSFGGGGLSLFGGGFLGGGGCAGGSCR